MDPQTGDLILAKCVAPGLLFFFIFILPIIAYMIQKLRDQPW